MFSILSVLIYYGTQSDIAVKSYCRLIFLKASVLNFRCLDIPLATVRHPSKMLLSGYTTGPNWTCKHKVIVVWLFLELLFWISSISIYYGTQSDIRVKSYCRLIRQRASVLNFKRLDILRDTIEHLSKKLLWFDFAQSFCSEFTASRYTTGHNRTSEWKVIVVWICYELPVSITSVSI